MRKPTNYDTIDPNQSGNFPELKEGPVFVKIVRAEDYPQKEYIKLEMDTREEYGKQYFESFGKWPNALTKYVSYKETATSFLKAAITAIEKSNQGFTFNWDERSLVGKYVYANLGYEEYMNDSGEIVQALKCVELRSSEAFKAGKIKTPKLKKYTPKPNNDGYSNNTPQSRPQNTPSININEDDLPF